MKKANSLVLACLLFFLLFEIAVQAEGIHQAVKDDDFASVKKMIEANLQLVNAKDYKGNTPIIYASNRRILALLLNKGADVKAENKYGWILLPGEVDSERLSRKEVATLLITKGSTLNDKNQDGETSLHIAARNC